MVEEGLFECVDGGDWVNIDTEDRVELETGDVIDITDTGASAPHPQHCWT